MNILRNESGASIIEVMIGFALAGVLGVVIMNLTDMSNKNQSTALIKTDIQEIFGQFNTIFTNKTYCENTLGPLPLGSTIGAMRFSDQDVAPFAVAGQKYKSTKVQIKEMRLMPYDAATMPINQSEGTLSLHFKVTLEVLAKNYLGGKQIVKSWYPRVKMAIEIGDPGLTCIEAKLRCTNRGNDAYVAKPDSNDRASQDPTDDDGCFSFGNNHYMVRCLIPANASNINSAVVINCDI
jgi:hypothetical protein